jgi:MoxR-like ATPase
MSDTGITAINEKVKEESVFIAALRGELEKVIVGQRYLLDRLMVGLLANGHLLLEGVPGLAKTLAVKTLAAAIHTRFQPHPVHPRPPARRPDRHADLQPQDRRLRHPQRPRVRQHHPGR